MVKQKEGLIVRILYSIPRFYEWMTQLISLWNWEKWQNRVFEDITGKKVLEIGVGPGKLYLNMLKKGYEVSGVEIRKDIAYRARRRIKKAGFMPKINLASVLSLPYPDNTFDDVVMTFVLSEIKNIDKAIAEIKRVLKKNGKFVSVNIGYPEDKNFFAETILNIINKSEDFYLERDYVSRLKSNGFEVKRVDFGPFNLVNKMVAVKKQNPPN